MGISWGGVITSTVIGIDPRFIFAIPVYGCGDLSKATNQYGKTLGKNLTYKEVWDPILRNERVKIPVLWFSWPNDPHFPLDCQAACYQSIKPPHMVILIPKMGHSGGPGKLKPDAYAFADSIVQEGKLWCQQINAASSNKVAQVEYASEAVLWSRLSGQRAGQPYCRDHGGGVRLAFSRDRKCSAVIW